MAARKRRAPSSTSASRAWPRAPAPALRSRSSFFAARLMAAPARPTVDRAFSRLAIRVSSTAWRCKSPAVGHTINPAVSVVGDEKRAVAEDQQARRPPPHPPALLVRRPAGDEVVVSAAGPAVLHGDADDLVTGARGAVP